MTSKANPLEKILPPIGKKQKEKTESSDDKEKRPLLHALFSPPLKDAPPSKEQRLGSHDLVRVWDVMMPPIKANMVHGRFLPTFSGAIVGKLHQAKSRITIEVHSNNKPEPKKKGEETNEKEGDSTTTKKEGDDSTATKATHEADAEAEDENDSAGIHQGILRGKSTKHADNEELHDEEFIVVRIFRPSSGPDLFGGENDEDEDIDEEPELSSLSLSAVDKEFEDGKWTEAYFYALADLEVTKCRRHTVELKLGLGDDIKLQDLIFANSEEASKFCSILESLGNLDRGRAKRRLDAFRANTKMNTVVREMNPTSTFYIVIDIVSAVRLPVYGILGTDPFIAVNLGKELVHRTDEMINTVNPIWTIDSGSLFMLETTPEKFFNSSDGLAFNIFHYDILGEHTLLGRVFLMQEELLQGTGERTEYPIILSSQYIKTKGAKLVLRFRLASVNDAAFMKAFAAQKKKAVMGAYADDAFVPVGIPHGGMMKREHRITKTGKKDFRVKPGPDPDRPKETKWMTKEQIDEEALKPSKHWIKAGSGRLGKLYFELIACDGLPNMDGMPLHATGGKTDAYASIIYEDTIVNTDVITDALNPRWLPWSQRAFVFNIFHPSSQLMFAVLDFNGTRLLPSSLDPRNLAPDDPIGRVTLDFSNLRPNTDYTMHFDLATSALVSKRTMNGTVTVRVRIEWENECTALIRTIQPPPEFFINVSEKRDWAASRYAIIGECDTRVYSMDTLASFVEELQEYAELVPIVKSALFTVVLWRGHLPVTFRVPSIPPNSGQWFKKVTVKLPLHSLILFVGSVLLVEDPDLFPAFLCFAVAWALIATKEYQNVHPSPWHSKRGYMEHLQVLLFNREFTDSIDANERKDEVEAYIAEQAANEEEEKEEKEREAALAAKTDAKMEHMKENDLLVETETTKGFGITLNPLEPILHPVQQQLEIVVRYVRVVSSIVTAEESRFNFWIINFCFVIGALLIGIPWRYLIHWLFRIVVWVLLGPWMKLVDIVFVKGRSREEVRKAAKERIRLRYQRMVQARRSRQMKREDALKLKHMKRYMFGRYIVSVPRFKEYRYQDWPLYPSHASPHEETPPPKIKTSFNGQHIEGTIIPKREAKAKKSIVMTSAVEVEGVDDS